MTPLRLIILGFLFYLLYRLIAGGIKSPKRSIDNGQTQGPDHSGNALKSDDELVEDPVCHTYIPKGQALLLKQKNKTYYFCSTECRDKFRDNSGIST